MKYHFMETRSEPGDPFAEKIAVPASLNTFYLGKRLPAPKKPLRITVSEPRRGGPDLIQGPYTYIVASDRLRRIFEELEPKHVQFLPVQLYVGAKKLADYHFAQVLDNIDAIDWSKSDLETYPEDKSSITKVRKLVLDARAVAGRNAFRLQGLPTDLVVSDTFRKRVADEGLTGLRFLTAEKFTLD